MKRIVMGAGAGAAAIALIAAVQANQALAQAGAVNSRPTAPIAGAPGSFADIVERVAPAVVSIEVESKSNAAASPLGGSGDEDNPFRYFFGPQGNPRDQAPSRALASGFLISADGYIVTNNHVVEGATKITVTTKDQKELTARVIGVDQATDLAVIKVEGAGLPFVSFEDRGRPRVGDWVVAVGNPFGLGGTATAGIVSAIGRRNVGESQFVDYMQIDAPINRGNSGGPTFDVAGRVVGVNTAIFSPSGGSVGIGFDIPADVAMSVTRQLISQGKVVRGYMGAAIQEVTPAIADSLGLADHKGALIADVTPGGPADKAGLKSGDLVLAANGHEIETSGDLLRQVALAHPGDAIHLRVRREGRVQDLDIRSGVRPSEAALAESQGATPEAPAPQAAAPAVLGLRLEPNPGGGAVIRQVGQGSDAAAKGLSPGDVIVRAGDRPVSSGADVAAAAAAARQAGRKSLLLLISHQGRQLFVALDLGAPGR
jgi:serine protease Do